MNGMNVSVWGLGGDRWIKYEEAVDDAGRWSQPYVPVAFLRSIIDVRRFIDEGTASVDLALDPNARRGPGDNVSASIAGWLKCFASVLLLHLLMMLILFPVSRRLGCTLSSVASAVQPLAHARSRCTARYRGRRTVQMYIGQGQVTPISTSPSVMI
jgi:hypothetical protein